VATLCHHCGRAACESDDLTATDATGKPLSAEFTDLGLDESRCGESPSHCEDCAHILRRPRPQLIVAGAVLALISLLLTILVGQPIFLVGMFLGGGLAAYGYYDNQQRTAAALRSRPPLPVLPRFDSIKLHETLQGTIKLDDDTRYQSSVKTVGGKLAVAATFGKPDVDRLERYRRKYRLADDEDVAFHAGFVVLRGPAGLAFGGDLPEPRRRDTVVPLIGRVAVQPFLNGTGGRGADEWSVSFPYGLRRAPAIDEVPVWLVPSLIQESALRGLALELQWPEFDPTETESGIVIDRIDKLELQVPVLWGRIESVTDNALIGEPTGGNDTDRAVRTITWEGLSLNDTERRERRHTFFIRFERKIDLTNALHGRLRARCRQTLSGVKGLSVYYPLGGRRDVRTELSTEILVDFELSLAGLRHEDMRVVPDHKWGGDNDKQENMTFEGVVPNPGTVMALTNALSEHGFYIKRVIENQPRTGGRADIVNRAWDIAGRRYIGVYPIDFHLVLAGEEMYTSEIQADAGTSVTALTVQGAYANPDMQARIENVWEQLSGLVADTLRQQSRARPSAPRSVFDDEFTHPWAAGGTPVGETEAAPDGDGSGRAKTLRRRLDQLLQALLEGRLSEGTYLELRAGVERELEQLG
jgi:hypothetical protein